MEQLEQVEPVYFAQLGSRLVMPPAAPEEELEPPPEIVMTPPLPPDEDPLEDEEEDDEDEELDPPVLEEMVEIGTQTSPLRVNPPMQAMHCPLSKL